MLKKGSIQQDQLMKGMIGLVGILGLFIISGAFIAVFNTGTAEALCKRSVEAKAINFEVFDTPNWAGGEVMDDLLGTEKENPFQIDDYHCETKDIEIKGEKWIVEGKSTKLENPDVLRNKIMDEMDACWYQFGEGRRLVFDFTFDTKKQCIICSEITLDGEAFNKGYKIENFYSELKTRNRQLGDQTYAEYFNNYLVPEEIEDIDYTIDKNQYVVFFSTFFLVDNRLGISEFTPDRMPRLPDENAGILGCQVGDKYFEEDEKDQRKYTGCDTGLIAGMGGKIYNTVQFQPAEFAFEYCDEIY